MYFKEKQFVTKSLPIGVKMRKTHLIISRLCQNDTVWVENGCYALSGVPSDTQHITVNHVPNGTSRASVITFFYQHFVPNGTFSSPSLNFWNVFLENR